MYHNLVDKLNEDFRAAPEDSYHRLLDTIEKHGYEVTWHNRDLMTANDLEDAWLEFNDGGIQPLISYLETVFGFEIEKI